MAHVEVVRVSARSRRIAVSAGMNPDELVMEYLATLRVAVTGLPRADELVDGIGARIAEARIARPDDGPAAVQAFLDRLGDPYVIAATVAAAPPRPSAMPDALPGALPGALPDDTSIGVEAGAVLALTAGAVVAPLVGPFVGMVVASCSPRWRPADKAWAWLLVVSPLLFVLLCLPLVMLTDSDQLIDALLITAAGAAIVGPVSAGALLGVRLSRARGPRPPAGPMSVPPQSRRFLALFGPGLPLPILPRPAVRLPARPGFAAREPAVPMPMAPRPMAPMPMAPMPMAPMPMAPRAMAARPLGAPAFPVGSRPGRVYRARSYPGPPHPQRFDPYPDRACAWPYLPGR
jgi:hypothetical protein